MTDLPDLELQNDVNTATHYATQRVNDLRTRLASYEIDPERKRRSDECQCRSCFYLRGPTIAGQAFTSRPCKVCAEQVSYATTHTQHYCHACAIAYGLCRECGGDMEMRKREDPRPPRLLSHRTKWFLDMRERAREREARIQAAYKRERGEESE